jgi:catechol-2,3-dioxygenase
MAMQLGHVHIKTREDPQKVAKFYIDNFGATVKREIPGRGCQLAAGRSIGAKVAVVIAGSPGISRPARGPPDHEGV